MWTVSKGTVWVARVKLENTNKISLLVKKLKTIGVDLRWGWGLRSIGNCLHQKSYWQRFLTRKNSWLSKLDSSVGKMVINPQIIFTRWLIETLVQAIFFNKLYKSSSSNIFQLVVNGSSIKDTTYFTRRSFVN